MLLPLIKWTINAFFIHYENGNEFEEVKFEYVLIPEIVLDVFKEVVNALNFITIMVLPEVTYVMSRT